MSTWASKSKCDHVNRVPNWFGPKINFTFLNNTIYDWPNFTKNLAPLFLFFHFVLLILSGNVFSLSHLAFAHFWILKSLRSFAKMGIISSYRYRLLGILSSQIPEFLAAHSTIHEREREREREIFEPKI